MLQETLSFGIFPQIVSATNNKRRILHAEKKVVFKFWVEPKNNNFCDYLNCQVQCNKCFCNEDAF